MSYLVKDYMVKEINTADESVTITKTAKLMAADKNLEGYVIILKESKPIGIVTERDIINKVLAKDLDPAKTRVTDIMSTPLVTVDPDDHLLKATELMQKNNIRKIAVVKGNIIYGVITSKGVALRCGEYVDKSVRDIIRWTPVFGI